MSSKSFIDFIVFKGFSKEFEIGSKLNAKHERYSQFHSGWSITATQKSLTADYWNFCILHFFVTAALPVFAITIIVSFAAENFTLISAACIVLLILAVYIYFSLYASVYRNDFAPILENLVSNYQRNEEQKKEKARSNQYTGFVLILIQYVYQTLSGCDKLSLGKTQKEVLYKQFGLADKAIDKPLQDLLKIPFHEQTKAMQTKIRNYFGEAMGHFRQLNNEVAVSLLQQMQLALETGKPLPKEVK